MAHRQKAAHVDLVATVRLVLSSLSCAVFAALLALAVLSTEHAFAQVPLATPLGSPIVIGPNAAEGGGGVRPGGGGVADTCPSGTYLAGFAGRDGAWMDAIGILCAPFNGGQFGPASPAGGLYGKVDGGAPFDSVACPTGTAINYILWNMTRDPDAGHVDNIQFGCAGPNGEPGPQFWVYSDEPGGFYITNTPDNYETECSGPGNFATGIEVRAGGSVEGLDLSCAGLPRPPPPPPPPAPPPVHIDAASVMKQLASDCPHGWNLVLDPSRLPANYERQTVTLNGSSILCARRKITASDMIKLLPPPCPPLMHQDANGRCVRNPLIVPNNPTPHQPSAPQAGPVCPAGWRKVVDPNSLSRDWVTRTISMGGITITCAKFQIQLHPSQAPQVSGPCADNQLRLADGSCPKAPPKLLPRTTSPAINLHDASKLLICEDGQPRLKDGQCPPPKPKISIKPYLLNKAQPNNGLH